MAVPTNIGFGQNHKYIYLYIYIYGFVQMINFFYFLTLKLCM